MHPFRQYSNKGSLHYYAILNGMKPIQNILLTYTTQRPMKFFNQAEINAVYS